MKIYTVQRLDKYDYDFSHLLIKYGCYSNKANALERARQVYEGICAEYENEMERYADADSYPEVCDGALYIEEDDEFGYYEIQFGFEEDHEFHSVAVEEWEMED